MKHLKTLFFYNSIALICLLILTGTAIAQQIPNAQDLRALRYYIEQDEKLAVAAELQRITNVFPDWTPPRDLAELEVVAPTTPSTQIDTIYALIARNEIEGARREIEATSTAFPNWVPPAEILSLISTADAQKNFDTAIISGDTDGALAIAMNEPSLLNCDRINTAWQLAELKERTGDRNEALTAYRQIVEACSSPLDLIATIEKADSVATKAELRALIFTVQQRIPASRLTFDALLARLLAGREPVVPEAPSPAPAIKTTTQPIVTQKPSSSVVASMKQLSRNGDGRLGRVRSSAGAGDFQTCTARSVNPRSLNVAYERAWCVYNLDRPLEALALFTLSARGLSGDVSRDASYGRALSMLKLNMTDAASNISSIINFTQHQRRTIEVTILDQRGVRAYQEENYAKAIIYFNGMESLGETLRRDLSIMRAYAYLNNGESLIARALFLDLNNALMTEETQRGLTAAGG